MLSKIKQNFILNTDSYKASHWEQYPEKTSRVFSYIESRGGRWDKLVFFGLQAFIKDYLVGQVVTKEDIDEAEVFLSAHGEPFNRAGWEYILEKYDGKLPIEIKAVEEGSIIPTGNVLVTVENTDPNCFWLTSYVETALLRAIWYPTTVATQSWHIKRDINRFLEETGNPTGLLFKLHDFGARGVSSLESAALGAMAHLVNFMGTDTISGVRAAQLYYGPENEMPAFSIPAAEHSTMTILGREGEFKQFERMLDKFGGEGKLVACVSDSYDISAAVKEWGTNLKQKILDKKMTLVVRPDSGNPEEVSLQVIRDLDKYFGSTLNEKGYRVLNPAVRMIYGDGINEKSIHSILFGLKMAGYSADNIAFGMGGMLLQGLNRDSLKFAMKASWAEVNGEGKDVFKDPITDAGKRSKAGRLGLFKSKLTGEFETYKLGGIIDVEWEPLLEPVFKNGVLLREQTFQQVREKAGW